MRSISRTYNGHMAMLKDSHIHLWLVACVLGFYLCLFDIIVLLKIDSFANFFIWTKKDIKEIFNSFSPEHQILTFRRKIGVKENNSGWHGQNIYIKNKK